mgnify:CR=1 FL=1
MKKAIKKQAQSPLICRFKYRFACQGYFVWGEFVEFMGEYHTTLNNKGTKHNLDKIILIPLPPLKKSNY